MIKENKKEKENENRAWNGAEDFVDAGKKAQNYRKAVGYAGEELAALLLLQRGYRILTRNFSCQVGEIDIIAEKDDLVCFVEVKTRLSDTYGAGRLAVNRPKQRHLRAAAQVYLQEYTGSCREISFDLIEIRAEHLRGLAI